MKRPTGVTILAWLAIIGGALEIFAAIFAVLALMTALAVSGAAAAAGALGGAAGLAAASIFALVLTVWLGVLGIFGVVFGFGALGLKPWAWTIGVIWCYVAAVSDVVNIFASRGGGLLGAIIGILFALAILYYLYSDEVRVAFGKSDQAAPSFMVPVFEQIDKLLANNRGGGQRPQTPGGYQPPQAPSGGGYPQAPAHYESSPPSAPEGSGNMPSAPPAPPAPPT
ncbi:MAG TPA: hypothetical protein VIL41_03930 [Coriobacteriia bacterium]